MTVNVRQPDLDDGVHAWPARRELLVEAIVGADPDLVGAQELFAMQAEYLVRRAPQFAWLGRGRYGDDRDKHVGIVFRQDRCRVRDSGTVWFSTTPDVPGSTSWGIEKPRQMTWATFDVAGVGAVTILNAHFPYRPHHDEARLEAAALVMRHGAALAPTASIVVTGDFNADAGGEVHRRLGGMFRDAWNEADERYGPAGTVHGFGVRPPVRRIDWVLYRAPWRVVRAETVTTTRDGSFPSDHFPVVATFDTTRPDP